MLSTIPQGKFLSSARPNLSFYFTVMHSAACREKKPATSFSYFLFLFIFIFMLKSNLVLLFLE